MMTAATILIFHKLVRHRVVQCKCFKNLASSLPCRNFGKFALRIKLETFDNVLFTWKARHP